MCGLGGYEDVFIMVCTRVVIQVREIANDTLTRVQQWRRKGWQTKETKHIPR
jgi:hypothetical protein